MSGIPPHPVGSVVQSPFVQGEQARATDADKNAKADGARQLAGGPDALVEIEETDADTRVHSEAGGGGSQGRYDAPPEEEEAAEPSEGSERDDDGLEHIDLSA